MNESLVRALSGIVYIILLIGAILFSPISFMMLFGIFLIIAITEFCRLVKIHAAVPVFMGICMVMIFCILIDTSIATNLLLTFSAIVVSIMLLADLFSGKNLAVKDRTTISVRLTGYIVLPFILIIRLPFLEPAIDNEWGGNPYILLGCFILIWANDTFAYIVGKTMGKHKLFERISPKKTVEGFAGGMVFAILAAYILTKFAVFITPVFHSAMIWMGAAVILVIFGTLGDLVESKLKRNAGVKDSGAIMPGHGGILDRLDSIIFAIPFLFLYYQIISYVS